MVHAELSRSNSDYHHRHRQLIEFTAGISYNRMQQFSNKTFDSSRSLLYSTILSNRRRPQSFVVISYRLKITKCCDQVTTRYTPQPSRVFGRDRSLHSSLKRFCIVLGRYNYSISYYALSYRRFFSSFSFFIIRFSFTLKTGVIIFLPQLLGRRL